MTELTPTGYPEDLLEDLKELWLAGARTKTLLKYIEDNNLPKIKEQALARYGQRHWNTALKLDIEGEVQLDTLGVLHESLNEKGFTVKEVSINRGESWGWEKDDDGVNHQVKRPIVKQTIKIHPKEESQAFAQASIAPINVNVPDVAKIGRADGLGLAISIPDMQCGYYEDSEGNLRTTHDEAAINVAHQLVGYISATEDIDMIVYQGDNADFPTLGKYRTPTSFYGKLQLTIDRVGTEMSTIRTLAPEADIYYMKGNHEARLINSLVEQMPDLVGLTRMGEERSIFDLGYLCRFDESNVQYADSYPDAEVWANEGLKFIHGKTVKSTPGATAALTLAEGVSTVYGHTHRAEVVWGSRNGREGRKSIWAGTAGSLCRLDGAVPSGQTGFNSKGDTSLRPGLEKWQQGIMVIYYDKNGFNSYPEVIPIVDGVAFFRGRIFTAQCDVEGKLLTNA